MRSDFTLATGILAGTIIGAGIFSLPYVFRTLGILFGFCFLLFFFLVYCAVHIMYARLIETRTGKHQFFYFAHTYLSPRLAPLASWVIIAELLFVLLVYLVLAPTFMSVAFGNTFSPFLGLLIFWFLGSLFMFARLSWIGWAEILGIFAVLGIVSIIFFKSISMPFTIPFTKPLTFSLFFLPFGPLLFSFSGRPAIPEVVEEHRRTSNPSRRFSLTRAILWGTLIPVFVYGLFVVSILKLNPSVSEETLNSLTMLSPSLYALLGVMGLITLWTSYFVIGINLKEILNEDLKWKKSVSWWTVILMPLILYAIGLRNFISVISVTGGLFLGLEALFVVLMWRRAFPHNKFRWVSFPLIIIFLMSIVYQLLKFVI